MIYPSQSLCINQIEWKNWNKVFSNNPSYVRTLSQIKKIQEKRYIDSHRGNSETPKISFEISTKGFDKSLYKLRKKKSMVKSILNQVQHRIKMEKSKVVST